MLSNNNIFTQNHRNNEIVIELGNQKKEMQGILIEIGNKREKLEKELNEILFCPRKNPLLEKNAAELTKEILNRLAKYNLLLKSMDKGIQESSEFKESENVLGIRKNIYHYLVEEYKKEFNSYTQISDNYMQKKKSTVKRELSIINPNLTEEELDKKTEEALLLGETNSFSNMMLKDQNWSRAKGNLHQYNQDLKDVLSLEKQLANLKQLFIDASLLISQQGEVIDNIEISIKKSKKHVTTGNQELEQAVERSKHHTCSIF